MKFDTPVQVGEIRLLADFPEPRLVLVLAAHGSFAYRVVPLSSCTAPASPREYELKGRVYQLWQTQPLAKTVLAEPAGRIVVAGTDNEEHALPLPGLGDRDITTIPADIGLVLHAGEFASPGERHDDGLVEPLVLGGKPLLLHAGVGLVERELPVSVQVHPLGALPVRPRMLGQRNLRRGGTGHHHEQNNTDSLHIAPQKWIRTSPGHIIPQSVSRVHSPSGR